MNITRLGPTGSIIRGHVLDVSPAPLERALRAYDPQLYLKWNAAKLKGWGTWEVRRRPEKLTACEEGVFEGVTYLRLERVELDIIHHVLDVPYLNYQVLTKIKSMDTWETKNWVKELEYQEGKHEEKVQAQGREVLAYQAKQNKRMIKDLREALLSGVNPAQLAKHWK